MNDQGSGQSSVGWPARPCRRFAVFFLFMLTPVMVVYPQERGEDARLDRIPITAFRCDGWIGDWADTARNGMARAMRNRGKFRQTWLGAEDRFDMLSMEQVAYWIDGSLRLGVMLEDQDLIETACMRLDRIHENLPRLNDGKVGYVWYRDKLDAQGMEKTQSGFTIWAGAVIGRSLMANYERTGNPAILRAIVCANPRPVWGSPLSEQGQRRSWHERQIINLETIYDALKAGATGNLSEVAVNGATFVDEVHLYWLYKGANGRPPGLSRVHGPMAMENLKMPALCAAHVDDGGRYVEGSLAAIRWVMDDSLLPSGIPSADEGMHGRFAFRGTESCAVVDWLWSLYAIHEASGMAWLCDLAEAAFFNGAAQTVTRDYMRHVYFQSPSRLFAEIADPAKPKEAGRYTRGRGEYAYHEMFAPECCSGNVNRIVAPYVQHMWLRRRDGGLSWSLYGPCRLSVEMADGNRVALHSTTAYPFEEQIELKVTPARPARFTIQFRIPGWCKTPELAVNGDAIAVTANDRGFAVVDREWRAGDTVVLSFPMRLRVVTGREDGGSPYATIHYGPLLMVHALPEIDENTPVPDAQWRFALDVTDPGQLAAARVERMAMPTKWQWQFDSPLAVTVPGRRVDWAPVPLRDTKGVHMPSRTHEISWPGHPVLPYAPLAGGTPVSLRLVPYGCAKFRLSMFPMTDAMARVFPLAPEAIKGRHP